MEQRMGLRALLAVLVLVVLAAGCGGGGGGGPSIVGDTVGDAPGPGPDTSPGVDVPLPPPSDVTGDDTPEPPVDTVCIDDCTAEGARRCLEASPTMFQVCERGADGCLEWSGLPSDCPAGETCVNGECTSVCRSDPGCAAAGDERCASNTTYQVCAEVQADCLKFGEATTCPSFMLCVEGRGCECQNTCTAEGQTRCFGDEEFQVCERQGAGCLVWSTPRFCSNGGQCEGEGECTTPCVSDCPSVGALQCFSATQTMECREVSAGCLQWAAPTECPGALLCNDGVCEATCRSDCPAVGAVGCLDSANERTCEELEPGCLKWTVPSLCPDHQTCGEGEGCACAHACAEGSAQCDEEIDQDIRETCTADAQGCRYWTYQYCPMGEECQRGECIAVCSSDPGCTTAGMTRCVTAESVATCGEVEAGCFQWGPASACPEHQVCDGGVCACEVQEGCTAGATKCLDATHSAACEEDAGGCFAWSAPVACAGGETCNDGTCSVDCTSDAGCTAVGVRRCTEGKEQRCTEIVAGCLKWDTAAACPEHQMCEDGVGCACANPCDVVGDEACDASGLLGTCAVDDATCRYLEYAACEDGESCVIDECMAVVSPEEDCGLVTFRIVDHGYADVSIAGSFNEWSATATPLVLLGGIWSASAPMPAAGRFEYKVVADGLWILDPLNPNTTGDGFFRNNIIDVVAVSTCDAAATLRCSTAGALEVCGATETGCLTWRAAAEPCTDNATYCADGACVTFDSPVIAAETITFTARDRGYEGLDVAGDFTTPEWQLLPMQKKGAYWELVLNRADHAGLTAGDHEYKFRTSTNVWFHDAANPRSVDDGEGGLNSVFSLSATCTSTCATEGAKECTGTTTMRMCTPDDDGCLYWATVGCQTGPAEYCLVSECEAFPIVAADGRVTFVLPDEAYTSVHAAGTFTTPTWGDGALALTLADGRWSVTTDVLAAGSYHYKFILAKGTAGEAWLADPHNPNTADDGFGGVNSVITVP